MQTDALSGGPRRRASADAAGCRHAAVKAQAILKASRPASPDHPYSARKRIVPDGLREIDLLDAIRIIGYPPVGGKSRDPLVGPSLLVVPIYIDGELSTVELIDGAGRKSFLAGGRTGGGYWTPRPLPDCDWVGDLELLVGEGVATVVSATMACPDAIGVAAMSIANVLAVGKMLRERYPDARIVYLGDVGIGAKRCTEAALATGGFVAVPSIDEDGADWNDAHVLAGLMAVAAGIDAAEKPEKPAPVVEVLPPGQRRNPRDYPLTEQGAAELFADSNRGSLLYVPERKSWMQWTGAHWRADVGGIVALARTKAISAAFLSDAQWAAQNDDARAPALAKFAARLQQLKTRENVLGGAKAEDGMALPSSMFDVHHDLLNFQNGTYDLAADAFREHRREDYQTIVLPYDFQAGVDSARWRKVVSDVWPDSDTQRFFERWIGYCLCGSVKEQKFVFLWGAGANGKSVVVKTILRALGGYARQVGSDVFAASTTDDDDRARKIVPLRNKRLVATTETKQGQSLDEEMVKSIASPDTQESRLLYCERETWEPTAKVTIMGNHIMRTRGGDYATDRRIVFLGCEQRFEGAGCDPDLLEKLADELPGIMNWAIEGHRQWRLHGLGMPTKVQTDTASYCDENDILRPFFEDVCLTNPDAFVLRGPLYQAFATWAHHQGMERIMSPRTFADRVQSRGFQTS